MILALGDKRNARPGRLRPRLVGLLVVLIGMTFGYNAGYAINPARDLGPRLFTAWLGGAASVPGRGHWWWVPIVGPASGAFSAAPLLRRPDHAPPSAGEPGPMSYVLALDQGTTSSRAILFGRDGRAVASAQKSSRRSFRPRPRGARSRDIWSSQLQVARDAMAQAQVGAADVAAVGITNQRETTILWDRRTGKPVANAIVWQSRSRGDLRR